MFDNYIDFPNVCILAFSILHHKEQYLRETKLTM